jgi:hypothetical protein
VEVEERRNGNKMKGVNLLIQGSASADMELSQ